MNNLEKIQAGMKVLKILSGVVMSVSIVGGALASIGAILVASGVLNFENRFLHFLSAAADITTGQLIGVLTATAISLLLGSVVTAFVCRYFTAELKEGTPFTNAGAGRIKQLGIIVIVLSVISMCVTDSIYEGFNLAEWNRFDGSGSVMFGICLILLAAVVRYGAELENKLKGK